MTVKPKKGNLKRLFIFNGLLFIVVIGIWQYSLMTDASKQMSNPPPVATGEFAKRLTVFDTPQAFPNLEFKTAFDKEMSLDDLKGQWIVLNFWATWCPPCLTEMPTLQNLHNIIERQGGKVVAMSLDRNMTGQRLREFMNKNDFAPMAAYYSDWQTVKQQVEIKGLPTTYILSPNGQAVAVYEGDAYWDGEEAVTFITSLLAPAQR